MKPLLVDLFCGAGGASMGYSRAGFDVIGIDLDPQPHYPFEFVQMDAIRWLKDVIALLGPGDTYMGRTIRAIHASPPCQFATQMSARWRGKGTKADTHPDLLTPTLALLAEMELPWVVENVQGAPRQAPTFCPTISLHGGMFGLGVHRPRLFQSNVLLLAPKAKQTVSPLGVYGKPDGPTVWRYRNNGNMKGKSLIRAWKSLEEGSEAMGIDWMDVDGLRESIPPAYTEFIGTQLLQHIGAAA